jgi:hypothetical protein
MRYQSSVSDPIAEELRLIRQNVPGVRASLSTECGQDDGPAGDKPLPARRPARRPRGK